MRGVTTLASTAARSFQRWVPQLARHKSRGLVLVPVGLVVIAGIVAFAAGLTRSAPPLYRTQPVEAGPIEQLVSSTGTLTPIVTVRVGPQVSGRIAKLYVDFNDEVVKGQVIARMDDDLAQSKVRQAQADVEATIALAASRKVQIERARLEVTSAQASLDQAMADRAAALATLRGAEASYNRRRALASGGASTAADLEKAELDLATARARYDGSEAQLKARQVALRLAELQIQAAEADFDVVSAQLSQKEAALNQAKVDLSYTEVRAPVTGVVIWRAVDVGQTVTVGLDSPVMFFIAQDLAEMELHTNVDEADVGQVARGQKVHFTVDAFPNRKFSGVVKQVRTAADSIRDRRADAPKSAVTFMVVVAVDNHEKVFLPGMTANATIVTAARESALKVPNAAVRFSPRGIDESGSDSDTVWILDADGRPKVIPVELGIGDGAYSEVVRGDLRPGDRVITAESSR